MNLYVIPNGLEKYIAFTSSRNLVSVVSIQFMNSRLDPLAKNLSGNDLKFYHKILVVNY